MRLGFPRSGGVVTLMALNQESGSRVGHLRCFGAAVGLLTRRRGGVGAIRFVVGRRGLVRLLREKADARFFNWLYQNDLCRARGDRQEGVGWLICLYRSKVIRFTIESVWVGAEAVIGR